MISASNVDVGRDPALFGLEQVRDLGIKEPPINEYLVADYNGYDIVEVNLSDYIKKFPNIRKIFCTSNAHIIPNKNIIVINEELPQWKKRTDVFHEIAHDIIPCHKHLNYNYRTYRFNQIYHRRYEREASHCGAEIQMPRDLFVPDALDLEPGIDAIKILAYRYQASLETTAIQYVKINLFPCAVVIVKPLGEGSRVHLSNQLALRFRGSDVHKRFANKSYYPLEIKYAVKSPRFRHKIRSGTAIDNDNPIFEAWVTHSQRREALHSSTLGVKTREVYIADIYPLGKAGTVMIFLQSLYR